MHEFRFEKLVVWQKAIDFADRIYDLTRQFPSEEKFGLTSQMRRASVSVSSNIAEGSGRISDTDFARFIEIAYGSVMETISQAILSQRRSLISLDELELLKAQALELSRILSGLRANLKGT
ncbi:MAG: four helix bundle protein [Planctomycetaceae bacterium]